MLFPYRIYNVYIYIYRHTLVQMQTVPKHSLFGVFKQKHDFHVSYTYPYSLFERRVALMPAVYSYFFLLVIIRCATGLLLKLILFLSYSQFSTRKTAEESFVRGSFTSRIGFALEPSIEETSPRKWRLRRRSL